MRNQHSFISDNKLLAKAFYLTIKNNDSKELKKLIDSADIADISYFLSDCNNEIKSDFVKTIANHFPEELFININNSVRKEFVGILGIDKFAHIIKKLDAPEIIGILENLDDKIRNKILKSLPKKFQTEINQAFNFPLDSAGRFMHKNFISVPTHWTVAEVHKYCQKYKKTLNENFYAVFVIDHNLKPIGVVSIQDLIFNKESAIIEDIMSKKVFCFNYLIKKEELSLKFQKYNLTVAAITNNDGRIIGLVTIDDVIDIIDETAEEDILHLGGLHKSDIYTKLSTTIIQRFPWLFVNLLTAVIASIVISFFDKTIESLVALAILMPVIASMGGNAGTQTVTIAVRAIATQELNSSNIFKIIYKELIIGLVNGIFFALICFIAINIIFSDIQLAFLFAIATVITLFIAGMAGTLIPILITKFKGDPAIGSGIILTTVTDVIAFLTFLGFASIYIF
jgi:magnesium transporter